MLGLLRRLSKLRGPAGVVALAASVGVFTGLVATHAVLAVWTYRDGARRDLRSPGRWALAVLVGGVFAFVPYLLVQRAGASRLAGPVRWVARRYLGGVDDAADGPPADAAAGDTETADTAREAAAEATADATSEAGATAADRVAGTAGDAVAKRVTERRGGSLALTAGRYGWRGARLLVRGGRWAGRRAVARARDR